MRRRLILCSLVACLGSGVAHASIHGESTYRDMVRPHGQPRSDAIYNAAVNGCYVQAHESRTAIHDTPAYKACMLRKGWRFVSTTVVRGDPAPVYAARQYGNDNDDDAAAIERENNDTAAQNAAWQQQQQQASDDEAAAQDAANAGYAQAAAQEAQDQSNAASFAAQMTVGNQ